jgi:glycosyltransferase involved in cell wall biosynthesis
MSSPSVSVVIPTFNRRSDLLAALGTISRQSMTDFECIVVDNGPSTDGTRAAVEELAASDSRFRVVQVGPVGIFPAANAGIRASRSPVVFLMDDDVELVEEGTFGYVLGSFESEPGLGVLGISEYYPGDRHRDGSEPGPGSGMLTWLRDTRLYPAGMTNRWGMIGTKFQHLAFGQTHRVHHVRSSAMGIRREAFDAVDGFFEPYVVQKRGYRCETDFCLQVRRAGYDVTYSSQRPQVLHKQAPRVNGFDRSGTDRNYLVSTGRNNAFFFLRNYWSRPSSPMFLLWDVLVGNTSQPGFLRLAKSGHFNPRTHWYALKGKSQGLRMFWQHGTAVTK